MEKLKVEDAILGLAASVAGRACELLSDGWVKGTWRSGEGGAETFCIHGAIDVALEEMFGNKQRNDSRYIEEIATAFIVDEAANQFNFTGKHCAIGFNDASERKHEEVISVVAAASKRLWDLSIEQFSSSSETWTPSNWATADVASVEAQNFLYQSLA